MKVSFLNRECIARILRKLMSSYDDFYWAVAWGTENEHSNLLVENKKKIKRLIFGTHFYQTDPKLLERFVDEKFARIMPNDAVGTFHPKVYLFIKGNVAAAIVGSANFTIGGMRKNDEAAIMLSCDSSDPVIQGIRSMVDDAWKIGKSIDQEFLDAYRLHYQATAHHRNELGKQRKLVKPSKSSRNKGFQRWSWDEYVKKIREDSNRFYDVRIALLKEARELFVRNDCFSDMSEDERRAIAGFLGTGVSLRKNGVDEWGWFGSMRGAGDFKNLIIGNNQYISDALDKIPLCGEVTKEQFDGFIASFEKAFAKKSHKGGVPTASRLLTMKRSDLFICVNKENKKSLGVDLGFAPTTLNFGKYWDQVVMPITECVWWQTSRPSGQQGKLWDSRSSMLDVIYYKGHD